jgi:hypothetical protein
MDVVVSGCDDQAIRVAIHERLPDHYDMGLNPSDMGRLVYVLQQVQPSICDDYLDWAQDFVSSIASTLGIEVI